jgi:hypothetical protein
MTLKKPEAENRTPETAVTAKGIWTVESNAATRVKDKGSVYVKRECSDWHHEGESNLTVTR